MKFDHRRIQSCRSSILIVTSTSLFKEDFLNHTSLLVLCIIISAFPIRFIPPNHQFRIVDVIIKNMINYILCNSHIYLFLMTIFFDVCDQYIRLFRAKWGNLLWPTVVYDDDSSSPSHDREASISKTARHWAVCSHFDLSIPCLHRPFSTSCRLPFMY